MNEIKNVKKAPSSLDAEQMLVGAILVNNEVFNQISEFIIEEHFYEPVHRIIYQAITQVLNKGMSADVITVRTTLKNNQQFQDAGGNEYIAKLAMIASGITNAMNYAKVIFDLAGKRNLINFGENVANIAYNSGLDSTANEQIEKAESDLYKIATKGSVEKDFIKISATIESSIMNIDKAMNSSSHITGISTGFKKLDDNLSGFHNSDLIVIAARPSMGKTAFAINLAIEALKHFQTRTDSDNSTKPSIGLISLEMSSEQLSTRMLSMMSKINSSALRTGKLNEEQYNRLREKSVELSNMNLFIDDTAALTIGAIRARARRMKRKHNLALLIVDYLQLIRGSNTRSDNRVLEIAEITQGLKAIAKELEIPVIALSQLSRAVEQREDKRPMLSDLRESGAIEQDADIVMFLYREDYYLLRSEPKAGSDKHAEWQRKISMVHNIVDIIIAKHRNGPVGTVQLFYDINYSKFKNFVHNQS